MNCYFFFFLIKNALTLSQPPAPQPQPASLLHCHVPVMFPSVASCFLHAAAGSSSQGRSCQLLCLPAWEPGVLLFREGDRLLQVSVKNIKYLA